MIICVAGDPGGSRAVLPVARALWEMGYEIIIPRHGTLGSDVPDEMSACLYDKSEISLLLPSCEGLIFGSSTNDEWPLSLAMQARANGATVMHVLDNWGNYLNRLCIHEKPETPFMPDLYTCIDNESREKAIIEGIPSSLLKVTGHPGLANCLDYTVVARPPYEKLRLGFICEPYARIYGDSCIQKDHPGFTEKTVLEALCKALSPYCDICELRLLPHPKQSVEEIVNLWNEVHGTLAGGVEVAAGSREWLATLSGVAGMTSILLYEAWLGGIPSLCIQPGCKWPSLRRYGRLEGMHYVPDEKGMDLNVKKWLDECRSGFNQPRMELQMHKMAPRNAAELFLKQMGKQK